MRIWIILIVAFLGQWVQASPAVLTYQGRILRSDSTALEYNNVAFIFQITNPSGSCVIYQEQVTGYNMIGSKGVFDVPIGSGTVSWPTSGSFSVLDAFNNSANFSCGLCSGYTCTAASSSYGPLTDDGRVLKVQFHDGNGWRTISPNTMIRSVPFAGYSLSAQKLGSHDANSFVLKSEINSNTSCGGGGQFLTWNATTKTFGCSGVSGASGGTVTEVTAASPLSVAAGTESSTPHLTIQAASATQGGYLSSGDWTAFNAKLGPATVFAGDVSGTASNISVNKIKNVSVMTSGLSSGDILKYSGGNWVNDTLAIADISGLSGVMAGKPDYSQFPTTCTAAQTLTFISPVGGFTCTNIAIAGSQVSGNISGTASGFSGSLSGDVAGTQSATVVGKLQGVVVSATVPTNNQVLKYNGSQWAPASLSSGDLPSGTLSGSGTAGYVPYYSGANTLANSLIYQATGNVGIGTASPNTSAALDVSSTSKGVLMPRMTTAQRNAIASPASGLHIYNTDTKRLEFFDGSNWSYSTANNIVRAKSSLSQSGSGVRSFNTKPFDSLNEFNLSTGRFQPVSAGKYLIIARHDGQGMAVGGHLFARVAKNGVLGDYNFTRSTSSSNAYVEVVTVLDLNGTSDYVEINYDISSGNTTSSEFIAYPLTAAGASSAGADNLGNHTLAQNLVTGSNWISSDGDNEGINISANGNVGVGKSSATVKLDVSGKVKADEFCLGSTCINTWPSGGGGMIDTAQINDGAVTQDKLATVSGLTAGTYGSSTSIPSITVDTKGRITAVTTNTVAALPAASGASGKFLKSNGTSWSGQDILFSDIKNSSGTSAFNIGACGADQTVAWSSLTDSFTCQAIGNLAAEKITSGTLDAARLPSSVTNALWTESSGNVYRTSGNVGIGTTSPTSKLTVSGVIESTSGGFKLPDGTIINDITDLGGATTSALYPGWPDAIVCVQNVDTAPKQPRIFHFAGNYSNSDNRLYYEIPGDEVNNRYLIFNSDKTWNSHLNAGDYVECLSKNISDFISEGKGRFFGNNIRAFAEDADHDTKIMLEKSPDEDRIRFDTAGAERMIIDNAGNVGIGTSTPTASALLDLSSTAKGFLPPRMTDAQKNAITSPATGLLIYNTTSNSMNVFNGSTWGDIGGVGGANSVGTTQLQNNSVTLDKIDFSSTSKGLGLPSMTTTQMNAISSPTAGMMVFNTTTGTTHVYTGSSWNEVGASGGFTLESWQTPTLQNGWVNYENAFNPVGYYKDPFGRVHIRGLVKSGTLSACIFTLPVGYRPANRELFDQIINANTQGRIDVTSDGCVLAYSSSSTWSALDGISFQSATGGAFSGNANPWSVNGQNTSYTNGNVGIGTTGPTEKLEVTGNIKVAGSGNGIKFPDGSVQTTASSTGPTWTSLGLTSLGTVSVTTTSEQAFDIPVAATTAREVLIYMRCRTGNAAVNAGADIRIYTKEGAAIYDNYLYAYSYAGQTSWSWNSSSFWLPKTSDNKVYIAFNASLGSTNATCHAFITGYR
ncbi:hypothetical protein AZI86_01050 [Bdellovibrio bacteriovorus]|uniref:Uncharacterized protein n=1 Tax=Bdellovibrio bacteriovorus TaxID=959 RepID=A0A150WMG7_BDEBC|nr:hypothetical protein [Bdellovibrio bacteriovorus]KYG65693.1 hypothetical protein AZI86_01050 [Bdellovibrio bacteriovorus]